MSDLVVAPIAEDLLQCFCDALLNQHGPVYMVNGGTRPGECCFRSGEIVSADASVNEDLCCSGLAWVRVADIFASSTDFPTPDTTLVVSGCGVPAWGIVFELGVLRCAPTGDTYSIPTCDQWTALQQALFLDQAAMREAMCCLIELQNSRNLQQTVAIGSWNPLPTSGGCAGGTWQVTVQVINEECCQ